MSEFVEIPNERARNGHYASLRNELLHAFEKGVAIKLTEAEWPAIYRSKAATALLQLGRDARFIGLSAHQHKNKHDKTITIWLSKNGTS